MKNTDHSRRRFIQSGAAALGATAIPFAHQAWADGHFRNNPEKLGKLVFGFNVPQTGSYADEGADELRAYRLAVKHINGEGDGGMLNTMKPLSLRGNGVNGMKVEYVTGDTQTKTDAARASAKRMIERDGVIMFTGGSSSGVAIASQSLGQEMGVIFMCGQTHSNDTTGKDKRRYGFRHFINTHCLAPPSPRYWKKWATTVAPTTSPPTTPGAGHRKAPSSMSPKASAGTPSPKCGRHSAPATSHNT